MEQLHVGRGTTRSALTVFPIWAEAAHPISYSLDHNLARTSELPGQAQVGGLLVTNLGAIPLLLLEGQLLEGGRQHRMAARSILLAPGEPTRLDVVCVEQGRWAGPGHHTSRGRRASARVRAGLRTGAQQDEVWRRVNGYDQRYGPNGTASYLEHVERADREVRELVQGLRLFPGQVGVLVGVGGQPLFAEVFDSPRMLAHEFDEIVRAAAMDAVGLAPIETPGRRARRFIERARQVAARETGRAGLAEALTGRTEHVDLAGLSRSGHRLYTLLTNPRHELVLAS